MINRRNRVFGAGAPLFYDTPLEIVRGDGVFLFDADGSSYMDLYNNVPCVGHGNRRVAEAIYEQQKTFNAHSRYIHESAVRLGERLVGLHHPDIDSVIFSCTGTEANEVAIRMAQFVTKRRGVICSDWAYHGNTSLLSKLTYRGAGRRALPDVKSFPVPDEDGACPPFDRVETALEQLSRSIDELEASGAGFAAFLVCPLFANEGLPNVPDGFFKKVVERVHTRGGLVIADEVQAGYGRTGKWWGYELQGFKPDVIVTGKPMGNGVPLAATCARRDHIETFRSMTRYFNTYGSSPLQAAAGLAVLDVIEGHDLLSRVQECGALMKKVLSEHLADTGFVRTVRGSGTFLGVEIVDEKDRCAADAQKAGKLVNLMKDKGFLISNAGPLNNVIKIRPPLVFETSHAERFLDAFLDTLSNE